GRVRQATLPMPGRVRAPPSATVRDTTAESASRAAAAVFLSLPISSASVATSWVLVIGFEAAWAMFCLLVVPHSGNFRTPPWRHACRYTSFLSADQAFSAILPSKRYEIRPENAALEKGGLVE